MRRTILSGFCVAGAVIVSAILGAAPDERTFHGEASVNVIEVPVSVFDRETGKPVTGLQRSDFRVLENGVEQQLTNFYEVGTPGTAEQAGGQTPVADRAVRTRQVVYFFDLFLMLRRDRDRAVEAVRNLYSGGVGPDEEVSIVSFDGTLRTHLDRSRDRRRILRALDEVAGIRARGLDQRIAFTEALSDQPPTGERDSNYYERRNRNREYLVELERRVSRVGDALSATMARFARAEGRRALVAFTPGQPQTSWSPYFATVDFFYGDVEYPARDLWKTVALEAADMGFTLFVVDSSGIDTGGAADVTEGVTGVVQGFTEQGIAGGVRPPADEGPEGEAGTGVGVKNGVQGLGAWLARTRKENLGDAATVTGGSAYFLADVGRALEGIGKNLSHWYSLAYEVEHTGDGGTYEITVELPGRPDAVVVFRKRYIDRPPSEREAQGIRSAMLFGGDANPLGIVVETGEEDSRFRLGAVGSKRIRIPLTVKIPIGRLDMIPRGDVYWGKVLITLFGEDVHGNQSPLSSHEQPITVPADEFRTAVETGYFSYKVTVEVEGGPQTIHVGVKDLTAGKVSIVTVDR